MENSIGRKKMVKLLSPRVSVYSLFFVFIGVALPTVLTASERNRICQSGKAQVLKISTTLSHSACSFNLILTLLARGRVN